jgi:hypothetical protein
MGRAYMRLFGAIFRALWVVVVAAIPSLLLPSASQGAVEFALIIGAIIGMFTFFEYGSTTPGFVDFRYAPPYNRFRAFTIAMQVVTITLVCRAVELGLSDSVLVNWAQQAAQMLDFKYSPVSMAIDNILLGSHFSDTSAILLVYSVTTSFVVGIGMTLTLSLMLWVFAWPRDRENFNLWANLPTFQPSDDVAIHKRLRRDAYFNIILGVALIYALPFIPKYGFDWLTVDIFENNQVMLWATTLWVFISTSLIARALAMLKIAQILKRAQG